MPTCGKVMFLLQFPSRYAAYTNGLADQNRNRMGNTGSMNRAFDSWQPDMNDKAHGYGERCVLTTNNNTDRQKSLFRMPPTRLFTLAALPGRALRAHQAAIFPDARSACPAIL